MTKTKEKIVMRLTCKCGEKIAITNKNIDDYNIFWTKNPKGITQPNILCPKCTEFWANK